MKRPFILITNDDGIDAPGIKSLWRALSDKADLAIVAPARDQSGVSLGITIRKPIQVESVQWENNTPAWKVTGTPSDCVRMACSVLLERKPDLIISGINRGANSGRVVLYSGTVAAVIEGVLRNIPGIAFSLSDFFNPNYAPFEKHIYPIISHVLDNPPPQGTFLNVNFPVTTDVKGYRLTEQGKGYFVENPAKREHPEGYPYYWLGFEWVAHEEDKEEGDTTLLKEGYITAAPIHVMDLTDHAHFKKNKESFSRLFDETFSFRDSSMEGV